MQKTQNFNKEEEEGKVGGCSLILRSSFADGSLKVCVWEGWEGWEEWEEWETGGTSETGGTGETGGRNEKAVRAVRAGKNGDDW